MLFTVFAGIFQFDEEEQPICYEEILFFLCCIKTDNNTNLFYIMFFKIWVNRKFMT
jgi:hypothetical protein